MRIITDHIGFSIPVDVSPLRISSCMFTKSSLDFTVIVFYLTIMRCSNIMISYWIITDDISHAIAINIGPCNSCTFVSAKATHKRTTSMRESDMTTTPSIGYSSPVISILVITDNIIFSISIQVGPLGVTICTIAPISKNEFVSSTWTVTITPIESSPMISLNIITDKILFAITIEICPCWDIN